MSDQNNASSDSPKTLSDAELLLDAAARAIRYRAGIESRPVFPAASSISALSKLAGPLPETGGDARAVLDLLDRVGSPGTVSSVGGRYFGFVTGSSLPITVASNWLATAWDQNPGLHVMSPTGAAIESVALRWTLDALCLPSFSSGTFVTGATMANFTALAAARHHVLRVEGWNVDDDGLFGAPPISVVVGQEVHASIRRVLGLLGLGRARTVTLPVDDQGRIIAKQLPAIDGPTIVCIQAGNVNTGAFDPAREICDWAHRSNAWVHVDGAFGLWARASHALASQADGYELADSWATDGHKWLNVPYDCGIAIVRDEGALKAAMAMTAAYLPPSEFRDPMHYSPDCSRRARAVDVWAALAFLGRSGLAEMVERCCHHAARIACRVREAGHHVLNDVTLNQVLVSFGSDAETDRVIAAVQAGGECWCGGTRWKGRTAMRISVSSWATTEADVERSLDSILDTAGGVGIANA